MTRERSFIIQGILVIFLANLDVDSGGWKVSEKVLLCS